MSCNSSIESQNSNLEWVVPPNKDQQETGSTSHWESPIMSINSSSSPTSYNHNQPAVPSTTVLWAVSSLDAVPPGSMLINPQTGEPFYNPDGTPYRFDPLHPLPFVVSIPVKYFQEMVNFLPLVLSVNFGRRLKTYICIICPRLVEHLKKLRLKYSNRNRMRQ